MAEPGADRWRRLEALFHAASAVPAAERESFVAAHCDGDAGLRRDLERLLAAHERPPGAIDAPVVRGGPEPGRVGQRLGPYRVLRELGRGGMGAVYLAERADGLYEQRVALKLLKRGMDTDAVLARFRAERQILASLDHPNIARLLDGGTTDDGLPFFAMEYVDGAPIDEWAETRGLSVRERVELLLQVCAAVSYAHQRLVVHRDLKPLNILVTADGVPKLLDFGIAKVLQPGEEETSTVTGLRLLTPEYASPEQVEGRHATTASDVYSLGVVLYELLTGRSPYGTGRRSPVELIAALRTTDPERPSAAAPTRHRQLRGDLDTIVLTALRKEPERRYPTVERFADDLRRHLAGLPVRARPDTFRYRTGKFVRRNRGAVAVGALAVLALVGGIVATAWQARVARAAQARAERRFADVRRLANALLFDYHDAIKDLRGAGPVRERMVRDALGWLDGLAREGGDDAGLQRELAAAYARVGDLQGADPPRGLGDEAGAVASFEKARVILDELRAAGHDQPAVQQDLADVLRRYGELVWMRGDLALGISSLDRADSLLAHLAGGRDADVSLRLQRATTLGLRGRLAIDAGDIAGAVAHHTAQLALLEGLPAGERDVPARRRGLSVAYGFLADAQVEAGDLQGALASHGRSLAIREALAAEFPDNEDYGELVLAARYYEGTVLQRLGRWAEAAERFRRLDRESPGPFTSARLGESLAALGRHEEALGPIRAALRAHEAELRSDTANLYARLAVAEDRTRHCASLAALQRPETTEACRAAAALMRGTVVEPTNAFPRVFFAGLWGELGAAWETFARGDHAAAAREAYLRSRDLWADLAARGLVSPADTARLARAERAVARVTAGRTR